MASDSVRPVTLAELVATLSLVADLGMGRPMERVLRQTVVAMRLGAAAGMEQAACSAAYYASLLTWVGCAVDTSEVAALCPAGCGTSLANGASPSVSGPGPTRI